MDPYVYPGTLNVAHLPAIHHTLFQDVYSWAGRFRTGNISIGGKMFCQAEKLETSLDLLLHQLTKEQQLARLKADQFAERAAFYWAS